MSDQNDTTPEEKLSQVATVFVLRPATDKKPEPNSSIESERFRADDDDAEIIRLAAFPLIEYERLRKDAAARMGIRAALLDRLVASKRKLEPCHSLQLQDPDPWPEQVDGARLLEEIACAFTEHLVLKEHQANAMALWMVHAHALDAAVISPRLAFVSPEKRCGKTTALTLMQSLVPRPLSASNITAAAVFRTVEIANPTLLIDEADTFLRNSDELRGILNSGHNRLTAFVVRTVGDKHEPARFRTWAAVAIAMIGRLPDTLADRSITISMQRKKSQDQVRRLRLDRDDRFDSLRRRAARWVSDNELGLSNWDGEVPLGLHDRAADNWRPLLAIAHIAGGSWPDRTTAAAIALSCREDEGSAGALLLQDVMRMFAEIRDDRLPTATLLSTLHEMEGRPWPEWKKGNPISAPQLARLLMPYGISPTTFRVGSGAPCKGYLRTSFSDAFARYVDQEP